MSIPARLSIVTLGVAGRRPLGPVLRGARLAALRSSMDEIAWFRTADSYLGIFGWHDLAEDAKLVEPTRGSFGGITLAINIETRRDGRRRPRRGGRRRRHAPEARHRAAVRLRRLLRRPGRPRLGGLLQPVVPDRPGRPDHDRLTWRHDARRRGIGTGRRGSSISGRTSSTIGCSSSRTRLRDELPPVEPGTQAATALGMSGRLDVEIRDRGPSRIELRTTQGRIRGEGAVDLAPTADGRTNVAMALAVKPQGFAANMMLGVALRTMPGLEQQVIDGLEANLDDLARRAREARRRVGSGGLAAGRTPGPRVTRPGRPSGGRHDGQSETSRSLGERPS